MSGTTYAGAGVDVELGERGVGNRQKGDDADGESDPWRAIGEHAGLLDCRNMRLKFLSQKRASVAHKADFISWT